MRSLLDLLDASFVYDNWWEDPSFNNTPGWQNGIPPAYNMPPSNSGTVGVNGHEPGYQEPGQPAPAAVTPQSTPQIGQSSPDGTLRWNGQVWVARNAPGGSDGAIFTAFYNDLVKRLGGAPPNSDPHLQQWTREIMGLNAQQAVAFLEAGRTHWIANHTGMTESQLNDAAGQLKAGQTVNPGAWRQPPAVTPATPAAPAAPATPATPAAPVTPAAPTAAPPTATGGNAAPPPVAPAGPTAQPTTSGDNMAYGADNPFLSGETRGSLEGLISDKGIGALAERLIHNYEGRSGGKFAGSLRPMLGQGAMDLQGLLNLREAAGQTLDEPGEIGKYLQGQVATGTAPVSGQGIGRNALNAALDKAIADAGAGKTLTGLFAPGSQAATLQKNALTSALNYDYAPSLRGTVDDLVREVMNRYNTLVPTDPLAQSKTGSILEIARQLGVF